ncbi:MAG: hypothetical protein ACK51F_07605 [Rhodospirillales bacterium]|jgi:hypothetical protein
MTSGRITGLLALGAASAFGAALALWLTRGPALILDLTWLGCF